MVLVTQRLAILVIVGTSTDGHSLRSQVGMGSEWDCLLRRFERTLWISDSEAGLKVQEKSGGVVEGEGECSCSFSNDIDIIGRLGVDDVHE